MRLIGYIMLVALSPATLPAPHARSSLASSRAMDFGLRGLRAAAPDRASLHIDALAQARGPIRFTATCFNILAGVRGRRAKLLES